MGLLQALKNMFGGSRTRYAQMMNGGMPVFTQFGEDIYASDIVQTCIRRIANEIGKLSPVHIRTDARGMQTVVPDEISRLLKTKPYPMATTTDFLEKILYIREVEKNVFIYPMYDRIPLENGGYKRRYTGFYPLKPQSVDFKEDESGTVYVDMHFGNGECYTFRYADLIHWRKDFGANEFMGGDILGRADNKALLKLLKTDDIVLQSIDKGISAALSVRGLVKINTLLDDDKQKIELEKFEEKLRDNASAFCVIDQKSDVVPLNINPKSVDKETIEFIEKRILANYGVSLPIYNAEYNEEQYQAFYETTLEPLVISLGRAFTSALFTEREIEVGNEVIFYQRGLMFTSITNKIKFADIVSRFGGLTDNQLLAVFGYPPFEGGDIRHQSLNYVNREIADKYQLGKINAAAMGEENGQNQKQA